MVRTYVAQKAPRRHSSTQRRILPRHGGTSASHDDDVEQRKALVLSRNSQRTLLIRSEGILERLGREALDHFAGRLGLDGHELTERHALARGPGLLVAELDHGHAWNRELAVLLQSVWHKRLQGNEHGLAVFLLDARAGLALRKHIRLSHGAHGLHALHALHRLHHISKRRLNAEP